MSVPYIHTFYTPKGYYFYDFNTNAIVRINKSVYDFLNEWEKNKDCPNSQSECGNIIDELKRAGFLSERHWTKIDILQLRCWIDICIVLWNQLLYR